MPHLLVTWLHILMLHSLYTRKQHNHHGVVLDSKAKWVGCLEWHIGMMMKPASIELSHSLWQSFYIT